jgi:hypothetical protein
LARPCWRETGAPRYIALALTSLLAGDFAGTPLGLAGADRDARPDVQRRGVCGMSGALLDLRGKVTRTSWVLPSDFSEDEWHAAGLMLGKIESGVSWWLGDWWAFGEHRSLYPSNTFLVPKELIKGVHHFEEPPSARFRSRTAMNSE